MFTLPQMPYTVQKVQREQLQMRGINYGDARQDGDMANSLNISARRYPYISTRKARQQQAGYSGVTALSSWDKLIAVSGTDLMYDGEVVGTVTAGDKQFAAVNTKMVIWPDKVYLDLTTKTIHALGATTTGVGAVFTTNTMTVTGWADLTTLFKVGDCVSISGCTAKTSNNKDIVIQELTATVLTVSANGFEEATEADNITVKREVPDLDYICASDNRLFGCSSDTQSIYASALGDPTNWNTFEGLNTDSYRLAISSEGQFTGCCKLSSMVLFWKEATLHKLLGDYPAEYSLYDYTIEGLRTGCHKSMQIVNEVLFYMGIHGVYAYSGRTPQLMSTSFGNRDFTDAVGGNDGDSYYLAVKEGTESHLFVYETRHGIWVREDDIYCKDFARMGRDMYFLKEDGTVHLASGTKDEANMPWAVQFTPMYEIIKSNNGYSEGKKIHSKLLLRVEIPHGSSMLVSVRYDGKAWKEVRRIAGGTTDLIPVRLPLERCDKFELKLTGEGACTILNIMREFRMGTEV